MTRQSGSVVCWHFDDLDAVFESDTCDLDRLRYFRDGPTCFSRDAVGVRNPWSRRGNDAKETANRPFDLGKPEREPSPCQSFSRDSKTDVLVMGAGITGAIIADALARTGLKVAVVDKRGLAKVSTLACTALVQHEIDTPLITLTRKIGKNKAVRAWRRSRLAVDVLAVRLAELRVPNVTRRDSLYLAGDLLGKKELRREHEVRRASGLPSRLLDRNTLREEFGISRAAALLGYGDLVIDPRKAAIGLGRLCARIFAAREMIRCPCNQNRDHSDRGERPQDQLPSSRFRYRL